MKKNVKYVTVVVGAVIKKKQGKHFILMSQRHEPECTLAHLKWELPGGKVKIGEIPKQALIREIEEETGIISRPIKLLQHVQHNLWDYAANQQSVLVFSYLCKHLGSRIKNRDHHVHRVKWYQVEDALMLDVLPGVQQTIQEVYRELGLK